MEFQLNSMLDDIEYAFGSQGMAGDGFFCECSPYESKYTREEFFSMVWLKMTGQKVDFEPITGNIPLRPCTLEAQGKRCNPRPPGPFVQPTKEEQEEQRKKDRENWITTEKVLCKLTGLDYDAWMLTQADKIKERERGNIAAELWKDKPEPKNLIDLGQIPEPEPEDADPIMALVKNRILNRQQLADVLLVPESTQDD